MLDGTTYDQLQNASKCTNAVIIQQCYFYKKHVVTKYYYKRKH